MAKATVFKNKLTKAQEDLFKALDAEKEKKSVIFTKISAEITKQGKANVKSLNSLNKEYLEVCKNNNVTLEEFVAKVDELKANVQATIDEYNAAPGDENELDVLGKQNEKTKTTLKNKNKRELTDVNIKIDRIEKELKELLDTRKETYETDMANYKTKFIELEKRKKFEVNKISASTTKEYEQLQMGLLKENKRSEIKKINKTIKQIRYNGYLEEKECWFRHLAEQKQFEIEYIKYQHDYKCETISLEKEYANKIEEAKFDRSMIEHNYVKKVDAADNNTVHTFNANSKKFKLQRNKDFAEKYAELNNGLIAQFNYEKEKNNKEAEVTKNIYNEIQAFDNKQDVKYFEANDKGLTLVKKQIGLFQKNIHTTLTFYVQNVNDIYNAYFKDLLKKENEFVDALLVNNVTGAFLQGNEYTEYSTKVHEIFNKFKETEESVLNSFEEYLNNLLNNLLLQVEGFIEGILKLNDKIVDILKDYHNSLNAVLEDAKVKGIEFATEIQNKNADEILVKEKDNEADYKQKCDDSNLDIQNIEKEFAEREAVVKDTEAKQQQAYEKEYEKLLKAKEDAKTIIEEKYVKAFNEYQEEYNKKLAALDDKFNSFNTDVEKEYKTKIGLL